MLIKNDLQPGTALRVLAGPCLALALTAAFFLFPLSASAHTTTSTASSPTFQVNAGFDTRYRDGNWIPVQVSLHNDSTDFSGTISINMPVPFSGSAASTSALSFQVPINLANGAQKQVTLYIPLTTGMEGGTQNINVNLLDKNGHVVRTQVAILHSLTPGDVLIGILSDQTTGFSPLSAVSLPNQGNSLVIETLNTTTLPTLAAVLRNFDVIVLDNFTSSTLSSEQLTALQTWVNQGGALIEVGGPEWKRTLGALPQSLLPVTVDGTTTLSTGTRLLPIGNATTLGSKQPSPPIEISAPVTVSTGTIAAPVDGEQTFTVLASGKTPLIVQARWGQGTICYVAFDLTLDPVVTWPGASTLWKSLVLRSLGDQLLANTNGQVFGAAWKSTYPQGDSIDNLLQSLMPNALPSPWLILILLLGYLVVLGPIRFLIIRWRKRRDWSWRIVLSTIVIFSLLAYGFALYQKGTAIASNTISIVRLSQAQDGSTAHITTYVGVFIPNQGNFQVHIPGKGLVQPSNTNGYSGGPGRSNNEPPTTISPGQNGTDVNLQSQAFWAVQSILSEQDRQIPGGITSHLTIQNRTLTGTITNRFNYKLSDVYVLVNNSFVRIGDLSAGGTKQVYLPLSGSSGNPVPSLADQIAANSGLPTPYGPYSSSSQPQNEFQRHMAILSALSGESYGVYYRGPACGIGSCSAQVIPPVGRVKVISSSGVILSGPVISNTTDPLLISGSPATIIGWADQSQDTMQNLTVNGTNSAGVHETLVQAPLAVNYAGSLSLPKGFVPGQIIDIQNPDNTVEVASLGIYTMTTGSMTFEFVLPNIAHLQVSNLRISEEANLPQFLGPSNGSTPTVDVTHLTTLMYNWQTGSWDTVTLNSFSFAPDNPGAYVGPEGRILVQFANQDASIGTAVFSRPTLSIQGTVAS